MEYYRINIARPIDFLSAGKCDLPSDFMHYRRTTTSFILYMILDGNFYVNVDNIEYALKAGDFLLVKPGVVQVGYKPSAVKFFWMHFCGDYYATNDATDASPQKEKSDDVIILPQLFTVKNIENFIIFINQTIHFSKSCDTAVARYLSTALLIEIADRFRDAQTEHAGRADSRRFDEITAYIDGNYKENLKVSDIAAAFGYNAKYLSKLFRKNLNMTVKEYITSSRLRASEFLLLASSDTVAAVAQNCGFANEFYFMRLFKRQYGVTPSTYRNNFHAQHYTRYKIDPK